MSGLQLTSRGAEARFYAPTADMVEVCIFTDDGEERLPLTATPDGYHHGSFKSLEAGTRYGLRTHGPWRPEEGLWHHPALLLVDPFARAVSGEFVDHPAVHHDGPRRDTSPWVPRGVLVEAPSPPRPGPGVPWSETVIYETHVRHLTMLHPHVAPQLRGTYAGAAASPVLDHLIGLGVTTVELMPVAHHVTEPFLQARGLRNQWGYSTLGWYAPHGGYATADDGRQIREFAEMVDRFHAAGLEVVVDVVFNHTVEGGLSGPILSMKGLHNRGWYRVDRQGGYLDWTGTGNTVDARLPHVREAILAALRWWRERLGVDGFRFDLAVSLGRDDEAFDASHLDWITTDPVLAGCKLIAEPWDLGPDGYRLGAFAGEWREWNGRFRDDVRDYWRGRGDHDRFTLRLGGSPDVFQSRSPGASVNMVTSHDGFTLADLVSYDHKHNESNGEANRDGHPDNRSWNSGQEGPSEDPAIQSVRRRRSAALLASTLLSAGVPMLLGGDELGVTHHGNNNAYPLDELNWYRWEETPHVESIGALTALRRRYSALRTGQARRLASGITTCVEVSDGDTRLLVVANPSSGAAAVQIPPGDWCVAFDSSESLPSARAGGELEVPAWTVMVLAPRHVPGP